MARLFVVSCLFVITMAVSLATPIQQIKDNNVKKSQPSSTRFKRDTEQPLQELEKRSLVTYAIGSRVPGDLLLAQASNSETYSSFHDVKINLEHPSAHVTLNSSEIISYVEINVSQSADKGNAYILEGGVGQRNIEIMLNINDTKFYNFLVRIYGYRE